MPDPVPAPAAADQPLLGQRELLLRTLERWFDAVHAGAYDHLKSSAAQDAALADLLLSDVVGPLHTTLRELHAAVDRLDAIDPLDRDRRSQAIAVLERCMADAKQVLER